MKLTEPSIFLIGETKLNNDGLQQYLDHIGAPNWNNSNPENDIEKMSEVYGRICYKSFAPGLNPNITKIRLDSNEYLQNIIKSGHESVLEHCMINFIFCDISRVFTEELIRHRVGIAISQESLRYVRLNNISAYAPTCIVENAEGLKIYTDTINDLEKAQEELSRIYAIDNISSFDKKKELTSAFRRIAPLGLGTTIGWSTNLRELRYVIKKRTDVHAEEEIRLVFNKVKDIVKEKYPNVFYDL